MGSIAYINGIVECDNELDLDIENSLANIPTELENWHRNNEGSLLFSFGIKESRLDLFFNALDQWALTKTLDDVLNEWYLIEVYFLIKYESNHSRIDCVKIKNGKINHRETIA